MLAIDNILGPDGAIARRLGDKFETRPQQLEMAAAVSEAFSSGKHLLVEAGTGVGKSFAYLIPAIEFAVKHKKRVVISTHTISLQEQLIEKDIPLIQSVCPDEFTAVLVKGRSNYLCQRRLEQTRSHQDSLFDQQRQRESLWTIEEWCQESLEKGRLGSLAELPQLPDPAVWERVCAEHGNCLGKKCRHYENCFWQSAKRRMQTGNLLIVNHALFFSDLGLRMAGVNYLPKYDLVILDEAHTVEDVAAQHFGIKISEASIRYNLRTLYDVKRGRGLLSSHGSAANDAITAVVDLADRSERFFERVIAWQENIGRGNGRVQQKNVIENDLSPRLGELSKRIKLLMSSLTDEEEIAELSSLASKVSGMGDAIDAIISQKMDDAVYWFEVAGKSPKRVTLHAAPINVAEGLRKQLFEKLPGVVLTSATLCTRGKGSESTKKRSSASRSTGFQPVPEPRPESINVRAGAYLPHWEQTNGIYAVTFRLEDASPIGTSKEQFDVALDSNSGSAWMNRDDIARLVQETLRHFNHQRYILLAWCVMPNHVHVVVRPMPGFELANIIHSWKRFSADEANRMLDRDGPFWHAEYFDHLVRNGDDLRHCVEYASENARKSGMNDWPWCGRDEVAINRILDGAGHGLETRATEETATTLPAEVELPDPAFAYIQKRLGLDRCRTLQLGSPFDYSKQVKLYLETDLPEPNDATRFLPAACEKIIHYLCQTNGGAFVLFTSYKMLIDAANRLKSQLDDLGLPLLVQGQNAPRAILLDRFRSLDNAILFGTSSFWQGIDVQGDKLRNVIIVRLPFAVPDEPLIEARLETITRGGGNAFMEYSVPQAVIKLKQGFGRLIRSKTDRGIVAILDSRIKAKRYGKIFLEALPECEVIEMRRQPIETDDQSIRDRRFLDRDS